MIKKIEQFINLLLPPLFIKIYRYIKSQKINVFSTISQISHDNTILYILGNGPSLCTSMETIKQNLFNNDCMVVNCFCNTELFKEIKPRYYVIADPSNLGSLENLSDSLKLETIKIVESLNAINWNLILIVPDFAFDGYLVSNLNKNHFINIYFYNTKNVLKYSSKLKNWSENYIAPPAQTVLNTCVYLGIFLKYSEINILGMDMSWHEDLELDQKTNELFIVDKHFYGTKKRFATLDVNGIKPAHVHEYLQCSVNALKSFIELKEFADYNNSKVYNLSPHSWVDAFERK